jgi:hypothetical protein
MQTYETQLKAIEGDDDDDDAGGGGDDECGLLLYALKVKRMLTCLHQSTRLPLILSLSVYSMSKHKYSGALGPLGLSNSSRYGKRQLPGDLLEESPL